MMHENPFRKETKLTRAQIKLLNKANRDLNAETDKQLDIIYHSAALALHRYHGWNADQICDLISNVSQSVWDECAGCSDLSMIEMLWNECGIELQCEDKTQRWFEIEYLNSDISNYRPMTFYEYLTMRQNQKKWIAPQITACILMALYRKENWKEDALGRLFGEIEDIKHDFHLDPEQIKATCYQETDFIITDK